MNAQAIVAAIAHEVRQPLTRITTGSNAAQRFLKMVPPEQDRAQTALEGIATGHIQPDRECHRSNGKHVKPQSAVTCEE
jgi:signal transduction histidine kinase